MTSREGLGKNKLLSQVLGVCLKYDLAILLNQLNFIFNQFNFIELLKVLNYYGISAIYNRKWKFELCVIKLPLKLAY